MSVLAHTLASHRKDTSDGQPLTRTLRQKPIRLRRKPHKNAQDLYVATLHVGSLECWKQRILQGGCDADIRQQKLPSIVPDIVASNPVQDKMRETYDFIVVGGTYA